MDSDEERSGRFRNERSQDRGSQGYGAPSAKRKREDETQRPVRSNKVIDFSAPVIHTFKVSRPPLRSPDLIRFEHGQKPPPIVTEPPNL